jgi:hypothetical protein
LGMATSPTPRRGKNADDSDDENGNALQYAPLSLHLENGFGVGSLESCSRSTGCGCGGGSEGGGRRGDGDGGPYAATSIARHPSAQFRCRPKRRWGRGAWRQRANAIGANDGGRDADSPPGQLGANVEPHSRLKKQREILLVLRLLFQRVPQEQTILIGQQAREKGGVSACSFHGSRPGARSGQLGGVNHRGQRPH